MSEFGGTYVNPLTDFGFKKIFGEELSVARISNFSPEEKVGYEESLKYYRDINNVVDTSREEGREEGWEGAIVMVVRTMLSNGVSKELICQSTGLSMEEVEKLEKTFR